MGLKKMGHPTIFEKMIFWGKYRLDQGSEDKIQFARSVRAQPQPK